MKKEHQNKAKELFENNSSFKELFVNKKGEFFTNENLAANSVHSKKDYEKILRSTILNEEPKPPPPPKPKDKFIAPTLEELKAMGEKLPDYLGGLKRDQLVIIGDLVKVAVKGAITNAKYAEQLIEAIKPEGFKVPTVKELKAKGDNLNEYLNSLERNQLDEIGKLMKIELKDDMASEILAGEILEALIK